MTFCNARRFFLLKLFCQGCKISPMRLFTLAMCSLFAVFTPKPLLLRLITEHEDSPQHTLYPCFPRSANLCNHTFTFVPPRPDKDCSSSFPTLIPCRLPLHSPCPIDFPISVARLKSPQYSPRLIALCLPQFCWHILTARHFACCARTANSCASTLPGRSKALLRRIKKPLPQRALPHAHGRGDVSSVWLLSPDAAYAWGSRR